MSRKGTRKSRASSISRASTMEELYTAYSQRYDTIRNLIGKRYGADMIAPKLDRSAFKTMYTGHAYPKDPRKKYEEDIKAGKDVKPPTQEQINNYKTKWEPYKRYSAQRIIEVIVGKEATRVASGSAKAIINRLRKERQKQAFDVLVKNLRKQGMSQKDIDKINLEKLVDKDVKRPSKKLLELRKEFQKIESTITEIGDVQIPTSAEEIRYMRTNEMWDYIKEWYDKEGKELYRQERAKGKSGEEARKAIYDLFFYNGS